MKTEMFNRVNQLADQKIYVERCNQKKQRDARKKAEAKKEGKRMNIVLAITIFILMILLGQLETITL